MGVYRFGSWLKKSFPDAISSRLNEQVTRLYIDNNSVVHKARNIANGEEPSLTPEAKEFIGKMNRSERMELFLRKSQSNLEAVVREYKPTRSIVTAMDGVVPRAKQAQSEARRMKAGLEAASMSASYIHSAEITPGTDLMFALDAALRLWHLTSLDILPESVHYLPHTKPGEGEHNIAEYMRSKEFNSEDDVHLFYGNDSDIIIICLTSPVENVYVARDFGSSTQYINIKVLREKLIQLVGRPEAIQDFGILIGLTGDDFRANTPAVDLISQSDSQTTSFEEVFNAYRAFGKPLTKTEVVPVLGGPSRVIDWDAMEEFFKRLVAVEDKLLNSLADKLFAKPLPPLEKAKVMTQTSISTTITIDPMRFREAWIAWSLLPRSSPIGYDSEVRPEDLEDWVLRYLESIEWVFGYYRGYPVRNDWVFPYRYSPTIREISVYFEIHHTPDFSETLYSSNQNWDLPIVQLIKVTPLSLIQIIPEPFKTAILSQASTLHDFFYSDYDIDHFGKLKEYEGIPLVPIRDASRIMPALQALGATQEHFAKFALTDEVRYRGLRIPRQSSIATDQQRGGARREEGSFSQKPRSESGIRGGFRGRGGLERGRGRGRGLSQAPREKRSQGVIEDI